MGRYPQHGSAKELHWHVWGGKATDLQRRTALKQHAAAADAWLNRAGVVFRPVSHEWRDVLQWVRDGEACSSRSRELVSKGAHKEGRLACGVLSQLANTFGLSRKGLNAMDELDKFGAVGTGKSSTLNTKVPLVRKCIGD